MVLYKRLVASEIFIIIETSAELIFIETKYVTYLINTRVGEKGQESNVKKD